MEGCYRNELYPGLLVDIVLKEDQKNGKLTRGRIENILTSKSFHSRGCKVRLEGSGAIGRIRHTYLD